MTGDGPDGWARRLLQWRTTLVVAPLVVGLGVAAAVGSRLLWAELPESTASAAQVTCWDGEGVSEPDECGPPTGPRGLRWVFPSFRPGGKDCHDVKARNPGVRRPTVWACGFELSGSPVRVTYSELASVKAGRASFDREYAGAKRRAVSAEDGTVLRYEWRRQLPDGRGFVVTAMYARHPYAVQVLAEGPALRESALATTVLWRAPASMTHR